MWKQNFNLNMAIIWMWITLVILKFSEVRCGMPSSTKPRNISLLQVSFLLIRIKNVSKIIFKIQNFKFWTVLMKIQNSSKIVWKRILNIYTSMFSITFLWWSFCGVIRKNFKFLSCSHQIGRKQEIEIADVPLRSFVVPSIQTTGTGPMQRYHIGTLPVQSHPFLRPYMSSVNRT